MSNKIQIWIPSKSEYYLTIIWPLIKYYLIYYLIQFDPFFDQLFDHILGAIFIFESLNSGHFF